MLLLGSVMAPKTSLLPEVVVHAATLLVFPGLDGAHPHLLTPCPGPACALNEDQLRGGTGRTDTVHSSLHLQNGEHSSDVERRVNALTRLNTVCAGMPLGSFITSVNQMVSGDWRGQPPRYPPNITWSSDFCEG